MLGSSRPNIAITPYVHDGARRMSGCTHERRVRAPHPNVAFSRVLGSVMWDSTELVWNHLKHHKMKVPQATNKQELRELTARNLRAIQKIDTC
jgi:hypothetical protein